MSSAESEYSSEGDSSPYPFEGGVDTDARQSHSAEVCASAYAVTAHSTNTNYSLLLHCQKTYVCSLLFFLALLCNTLSFDA